jgi:adenylate cyclase
MDSLTPPESNGATERVGGERRRRPRGRGLTLQVNIISAFATLLVIIVVSLVMYAYQKNAGAVLDLMGRFVERTASSGIANVVALLDPVGDEVRATAELAAIDEAKGRDGSLFPYMMSILEGNPQLQSLYLAFHDDGRFLQAFPIPPGTEKFGANDSPPPPGAQFALRVIDRKAGYSDVWTYVKRDGTVLGQETSNTLNYDARSRDWYKDLLARRALIWTDLVVYTSSRQPGIAAAAPILGRDGRFIGAVAANITTKQMSEFLAGLDLGKGGVALIVDEQGRIIAFPDARRALRQDGLKLSLVKADELGDARITSAFDAYRRHPAPMVRFESDGRRYLSSFSGLPEIFGKKWLLAIIVAEDDFVGTLIDNTRDIVILGLALMVLGMIALGVLSRWISRPLAKLVKEIHKIQKFELDGPIALYSRVAEVSDLIHSLNMMKRALRSFGMFVPRDLVRDLVASGRPIELGGQHRVLTVMFTDVADFTSLAERMEAGALLVHVSRHLAAISGCIGEEEGTVDKYIGDAVMAFWGAPNPQRDHALRACTAALKARLAQARMNDEWAATGLPTMFVRMGLHTSDVIVGNIGSEARMSYTAVGDGVNVASRLEGVNKVYGTQICVSDSVVAEAGEAILVRPVDVVAVKGREAGERINELVALRHGPPELLASPRDLEICDLTSRAFTAYRARLWDEAITLYERLAQLSPGDKLPGIFIPRCRDFKQAPPAADWNGVHKLKTK